MKALASIVLVLSVLVALGGVGFAQTAPAAPPAGGTFEQRLAQRKSERNVQLDEKQQRRIGQRCTKAQQRIRELQQSTTQIANNRNKTYGNIDGKLWVIIGMLKLAEADTFKLEQHLAQFATHVQGFQTVMGYYQQTLDDIAVINCQVDVVGFQALVDTARIYHDDLRERSTDIREYVVNQIKPTLGEYMANL